MLYGISMIQSIYYLSKTSWHMYVHVHRVLPCTLHIVLQLYQTTVQKIVYTTQFDQN